MEGDISHGLSPPLPCMIWWRVTWFEHMCHAIPTYATRLIHMWRIHTRPHIWSYLITVYVVISAKEPYMCSLLSTMCVIIFAKEAYALYDETRWMRSKCWCTSSYQNIRDGVADMSQASLIEYVTWLIDYLPISIYRHKYIYTECSRHILHA